MVDWLNHIPRRHADEGEDTDGVIHPDYHYELTESFFEAAQMLETKFDMQQFTRLVRLFDAASERIKRMSNRNALHRFGRSVDLTHLAILQNEVMRTVILRVYTQPQEALQQLVASATRLNTIYRRRTLSTPAETRQLLARLCIAKSAKHAMFERKVSTVIDSFCAFDPKAVSFVDKEEQEVVCEGIEVWGISFNAGTGLLDVAYKDRRKKSEYLAGATPRASAAVLTLHTPRPWRGGENIDSVTRRLFTQGTATFACSDSRVVSRSHLLETKEPATYDIGNNTELLYQLSRSLTTFDRDLQATAVHQVVLEAAPLEPAAISVDEEADCLWLLRRGRGDIATGSLTHTRLSDGQEIGRYVMPLSHCSLVARGRARLFFAVRDYHFAMIFDPRCGSVYTLLLPFAVRNMTCDRLRDMLYFITPSGALYRCPFA